MYFKNVLIVNKDDNKIIYPSVMGSIDQENINNLNFDNNGSVVFSPSKNNKLMFALSDDLIPDHIYKFSFDIFTTNSNNYPSIFIIDINDGQKISQTIDISNISKQITLNIISKKQLTKKHNRIKIEVPLINILNFSINGENIPNICLKNIKLIDSTITYPLSQNNKEFEQFIIYHYHTSNNPENQSAYTYNQQAQKLRYILLKDLDQFKNRIVWIYSITENDFSIKKDISKEKVMFYCDDVVKPDVANKIKEFCALIGKNRYYFGYECPSHPCHKWKLDSKFLVNNFDHIYTNCGELVGNPKCVWIPGCHYWFFDNDDASIVYSDSQKKDYFMTNNPIGGPNPGRDNIIETIGKKCDFHFYGNHPRFKEIFKNKLVIEPPSDLHYSLKKRNIFSKFKYILVCENNSLDGYISEKLVDCMTCSSLPIYYGPVKVKKYFPELFDNGIINGYDYTFDQLINKLNNMSNEEYNSRINKIKQLSQTLIKSFTECSSLSLIIQKYFSGHNIKITVPEGTKYLEKINMDLLNTK